MGTEPRGSSQRELNLTVDKLVALTAALNNLNKIGGAGDGGDSAIVIEKAQFGPYVVELKKVDRGTEAQPDIQYAITAIWNATNPLRLSTEQLVIRGGI